MIKKHKIISDILQVGIVAVVRAENNEKALKIIEACLEGGLQSVEITFTVDKAHHIIETIAKEQPQCNIGAGTVLDSETARIAILSGAKYIVSPSFDKQTAKMCNRYAVPYMAGCYTPTEVVRAMEYGVDIIKLFPGSGRSPSIIKAYKAPLPQANIMPTGGVSLDNAADWIRAGAVALGIGGDLTAGIKDGDFGSVSKRAIQYIKIVAEARKVQKK